MKPIHPQYESVTILCTGCNTAYFIDKSTGHILPFPRGGAANAESSLTPPL